MTHDPGGLVLPASELADAIVVADSAGAIVKLNGCAERTFGRNSDGMVGQLLTDLFPSRVKRSSPSRRNEFRNDGTRLTVSVTVSPVRDADRRIF